MAGVGSSLGEDQRVAWESRPRIGGGQCRQRRSRAPGGGALVSAPKSRSAPALFTRMRGTSAQNLLNTYAALPRGAQPSEPIQPAEL